ncbi:DNA-processing protein DprA [Cryobacterium psychrophilum]|uniref:DNA-protecting protein DprA n=1 Tax=Cryobacterium psychrophilum TaxID=41988 RepID=A0A4Y8KN64_9MICO|nr:DNA-processing protein DprA [Cryobacterium psychrophilum]TDW26902.1 DNA processing protein [Cryobacterium psychrophilum]TFD75311.1 DNA-protecting protein DprA [Cryobacterium psychrophilum]
MTTLGSITAHLTATRDGCPTQDLTLDTLARAVWSIIGEPGNHNVGALVTALGAEDALNAVLAAGVGGDTKAGGIDVAGIRERVLPRATESTVRGAFAAAAAVNAVIITPEHPHWPAGFTDLGVGAPHALWARGNTALLAAQPSIAVVGARAATGYGEHVCMDMVAGLVDRGHTIVSGAAYGIDGMAHRAALASYGHTVAYLAGGIDRFYPSGHDGLLTRIVEAGVVASELACGSSPTAWRFLQRNRLIAAGSNATLVIEAGYRSGSLNVAGHAASLGRPVGAVPGPITSPTSAGCHRLISAGAHLVTTATDAAAL